MKRSTEIGIRAVKSACEGSRLLPTFARSLLKRRFGFFDAVEMSEARREEKQFAVRRSADPVATLCFRHSTASS